MVHLPLSISWCRSLPFVSPSDTFRPFRYILSPPLRLPNPHILPQPKHPPQRLFIIRHLRSQALPICPLQRLQTLLNTERRFTEKPSNLRRHISNQFNRFSWRRIVKTTLDVM